ncbi:MAG: hypothetical protein KKH72_10785 [Alphaproteobacteria bacterium]|nr:hypothetical protein [Alphaproteobacteria bacterium]
MKKTALLISLALAGSIVAPAAFAKTYTVTGYPNNDKCYLVEHIPATYEVNTKGIKVKGESSGWSAISPGKIAKYSTSPAVYIQTKSLIEADHYSLVPTGCK